MMTMTELANWLQVSQKTIQRWIKAGVPVTNVGGGKRPDWRFDRKEVRTWLEVRGKESSGDD